MTYFHRRTSTIIGAKAFHGPVRDGKGWAHLAMVVRHKGVRACRGCGTAIEEEANAQGWIAKFRRQNGRAFTLYGGIFQSAVL